MVLFWRVWALVIAVNVVVLSVFVTLATLRFASIDGALVGERLLVLANRTAAPFAAAARIGLSLGAVRNAPAVLERARQTDDSIVAIHVFDHAGKVLHSTQTPAPERIPQSAVAALGAADGKPWHRETDEGFLSSVEIRTSAGARAGGVLIVYPLRGRLTSLRAMGAELALVAVAVLVLSSLLGALVLRLGLAPQVALFRAVDQAVETFERHSWRQVFATRGRAAAASDPAAAAVADDCGADDGIAAGPESLARLLSDAERRYLHACSVLEPIDLSQPGGS